MIETMKFLSITGPKADIDRVVEEYLSKYEIHLENAITELRTVQHITPYIQINPYKDKLFIAEDFIHMLPEASTSAEPASLSIEDASSFLSDAELALSNIRARKKDLQDTLKDDSAKAETIEPFQALPCDLNKLFAFKFIRPCFGRIDKNYYAKFFQFAIQQSDVFFYECKTDSRYVWGVYFAMEEKHSQIDAVFSSLHFEKIFLGDYYNGTPEEAYQKLMADIRSCTAEIQECDQKIDQYMAEHAAEFLGAQKKFASLSRSFDVRKLAACTRSDGENFFILCGWMAAQDAERFSEEISRETDVYCIIEDDQIGDDKEPPTKLKNPKFFKPFEMFVKMYGLPRYTEFDPTIFLAITYSVIFGIMFADAGQGLCLLIGGFLLYKLKKIDLGAILGTAGIFSTIFGLLFNSVFGFEGYLPYEPLLRPKEDMVTLPLIGSINTVFVLAITFGMFMILFNMVLGIINAAKQKDTENIFFSQNAIAGIIFYGSIVALIFLYMSGSGGLSTLLPLLAVLLVLD